MGWPDHTFYHGHREQQWGARIMTTTNTKYPVLPLRDIVVFPHMIVPLFVGREKSIKALEDVMNDDKQILLTTQRDAANDDPGKEDVYQIGTIGTVLQLLKLPDGTVKVLVEGAFRAKISNFTDNETFFEAYADKIATHLAVKISEKQDLLELESTLERLEKIYGHMEGEIGVLQVEKRIRNRVN